MNEQPKPTFADIVKMLEKISLREAMDDQENLRKFIDIAAKLSDFLK